MIKKIIKNFLKKLDLIVLNKENFLDLNIQKFKNNLSMESNHEKEISIESLLSHFSKNYKNSHGQLMQDLFVDYILDKDQGFFIEIGACDGLVHSNTYWLEKKRNWKGILCEPSEFWIQKLKKNRSKSIIETKPIFNNSKKKVNFNIKKGGRSFISHKNETENNNIKQLDSISINELISNYNVVEIDYLSIDTEGSEFEIIKDLNFKKFKPSIITVEHNYDKLKRNQLFCLLKKNNYTRVFKSISRFDDWYVDNNILSN